MTKTTPQRFDRIVFIHGVGLCADAWNAMRPEFAGLECLFLELPAHGRSSAPPARSMDEMAGDLAQAIPPLSLVVGHSIGALITLEILANEPNEIAGAVLVSPIFERSDAAKRAVRMRADALARGENDPEATLDRWYGREENAWARMETRKWLEQGGAGYAAAYRIFADYEDLPMETLATIETPILVLTGAKDPNSTPEMAKNLALTLPNATAAIIPNAAHMLTMTHPKLTAEAILGWTKEANLAA